MEASVADVINIVISFGFLFISVRFVRFLERL